MGSFVDVVRPTSKIKGIAYDGLSIIGASLVLALLSQFEFPLWFTPVPVTLQAFGIMLIAATLGSKRGALALLAYLGEGALGLPVFSGGAAGVAHLAGPTGGYLFSFVIGTFVMGFLLERGWKESHYKTFAALAAGTLLILGGGTLWLSAFVGLSHAWALGFSPFVISGAVKCCCASAIIPLSWKAFRRFSRDA